ncbi:MAG: anti-sigma factor [Cyanosarcina radialis HA8281-LM2]|jgi:anti-sigma-K factor RskA|nr:anti-sigma factor [Cyanosarcina radialis HA8281-LM2]
MSEPTVPDRIEELMAGYVLNLLSPEEAEELKQYLQQNPQLVRQIARSQELMALIGYAPARVAAPASLRSKILAEARSVAPAPNLRKIFIFPFSWQQVAMGAIAVLALALGINNYYLQQKLATTQERLQALQGPDTQLFALKGTAVAPNASGSIVLDLEAGRAVLALQNLPRLPAGQHYHMWAMVGDKQIRCGRFNSNEDKRVVEAIPIPIDEYTAPVSTLLVTKESADNPSHPSQDVVMQVIS